MDGARRGEPLVLVIYDTAASPRNLIAALADSGFRTESTRVSPELAEGLRTCGTAVILFDVARRGEGLALCAEICANSDTPLLLLANGDNETDRLLGLQLEAVDAIRRPRSPRDVFARSKAMLRRTRHSQSLNADGLVIDTDRYVAALDGHVLDLTPIEFRLLVLFASDPGRAFERIELFQRLYRDHCVVDLRAVDGVVRNLRRKLSVGRCVKPMIVAVHGTGYSLRV